MKTPNEPNYGLQFDEQEEDMDFDGSMNEDIPDNLEMDNDL